MIGVKVDVNGADALMKRFQKLAAEVRDTAKPNRAISIELIGFVFKNFQTEGGMSEAGQWEPLAQSTIDAKARAGYSMILQNEGELRTSFQPFYDSTMAGVGAQKLGPVSKAAKKAAAMQKRKGGEPPKIALRPPDIAAVHEYGSATVPARPMLPSQAQALGMGMRVYNLFITEARAKAQL